MVKECDDPCTYGLRWFTPVDEIDLCGHCTFGAAYILFRFFNQQKNEIHFNTLKCGYHLVITKQADILVVAIGKPKFVTDEYVKEGAVVIDVGIHRNEDNKLCGDVDYDKVAPLTKAITPVPGGVGPMTIAMLMNNCVRSLELQ